MSVKSIVIPLACLAVGFGVGLWFPETQDGAPAGEAAPPSAPRPVPRTPRPTPLTPPVSRDKPEGDMLRVPSGLIAGLSEAQGSRRLDEDLFSGNGVVESALEITASEKAAIQKAWRATLAEIRAAETGAVRSEAIDEWSQLITVPDLTAQVAALGAGLRGEVHEALGQDRADVFLAAKQVDRMFSQAPAGRTLKVTTEEIGNGQWRFRIEQEGGEGRRVWLGETIPDELRHLTAAAGIGPKLGD